MASPIGTEASGGHGRRRPARLLAVQLELVDMAPSGDFDSKSPPLDDRLIPASLGAGSRPRLPVSPGRVGLLGAMGRRVGGAVVMTGIVAGILGGHGGPSAGWSASSVEPAVAIEWITAEPPALAEAPGPTCRRPWSPPVDAVVIDPFRPPDHRFGPGNRGLEYDTEPGQRVQAVAPGTVTFAGQVGGTVLVVVDHGAGLRSTSFRLTSLAVARGAVVDQGATIGSADGGFHLTARLGPRYVDPAELLDRRCQVVRLVPIPHSP